MTWLLCVVASQEFLVLYFFAANLFFLFYAKFVIPHLFSELCLDAYCLTKAEFDTVMQIKCLCILHIFLEEEIFTG